MDFSLYIPIQYNLYFKEKLDDMEHIINVEIFEDKGFKKIWCSDGHYMTDWNKENIEQFTYSRIIYCPISLDHSNIYCITEEEKERLEKEQMEFIENKEKEN